MKLNYRAYENCTGDFLFTYFDLTVLRILLDTPSTPKTLAYLLPVMVFPAVGILLYY